MAKGLTSTKHFGFAPAALGEALRHAGRSQVASFAGNAELAHQIGIGVIQLESLGAWMRFANLIERSSDGVELTALGRCICDRDPVLADPATWWVLHWELARSYVVWAVLSRLAQGGNDLADIEGALHATAPGASARTIKNARIALVRALEETPLGGEMRLVQVERDGQRVTGLTKLPVRHGQAPMAAVAYALLDWSHREEMPSAALESLAAHGGPGPVLHMSEGALERYLTQIDGAFRSRVLSYSRTAGLNEAYFKHDVTPLQVLVSHYIHAREDMAWTEALDRAQREMGSEDATDG